VLYVSLIGSSLLLLAVNGIVFRARHPVAPTVALSLSLSVGPCFLFCLLPPVAMQGLLLCGCVILWRLSQRGPSFFLALSGGATVVAYGIAGFWALESQREYARLRDRYPYESMEARLPEPKPDPRQAPLAPDEALRLTRMEEEIDQRMHPFRSQALRMLHEQTVNLFVNSPGFGLARMFRPAEWSLANRVSGPVPVQPGARVAWAWSPGDIDRPSATDESFLRWIVDDSVIDFVNPQGFGYVKDRRHVAGFEPHRFSQVPLPRDRWRVQDDLTHQFSRAPTPAEHWKVPTLDLVSLLLHDEPMVYVSDHLPQMVEVRDAPTRPLDRFERLGLAALRQGEELFLGRSTEGLRMLGAISSTRQCVACHGGKRGNLLGAFSYTLKRQESGESPEAFYEH
jgi:hypothetical protein